MITFIRIVPAAENAEIRAASAAVIRRGIDLAARLSASVAVMHGGKSECDNLPPLHSNDGQYDSHRPLHQSDAGVARSILAIVTANPTVSLVCELNVSNRSTQEIIADRRWMAALL